MKLNTLRLPDLSPPPCSAIGQQPLPSLTARAGRRQRPRKLPLHPRLPGADQRRRRRHPAARAPPTCRVSTPSRRSIAPPATTSSACCCRKASSPRCPAGARLQQSRHRVGQRRRGPGQLGALRFRPAPRERDAVADALAGPVRSRPQTHRIRSRRRHRRCLPDPGRRAGDRTRRAGRSGSRRSHPAQTIAALVNAQLRPGADAPAPKPNSPPRAPS